MFISPGLKDFLAKVLTSSFSLPRLIRKSKKVLSGVPTDLALFAQVRGAKKPRIFFLPPRWTDRSSFNIVGIRPPSRFVGNAPREEKGEEEEEGSIHFTSAPDPFSRRKRRRFFHPFSLRSIPHFSGKEGRRRDIFWRKIDKGE